MDATMRITSSTVFNKILLFMIKEVRHQSQLKLSAMKVGDLNCEMITAIFFQLEEDRC